MADGMGCEGRVCLRGNFGVLLSTYEMIASVCGCEYVSRTYAVIIPILAIGSRACLHDHIHNL